MTYQQYIYKLCKDVDMEDPEEATQLAQTLASIALEYISTTIKQDKKAQGCADGQ